MKRNIASFKERVESRESVDEEKSLNLDNVEIKTESRERSKEKSAMGETAAKQMVAEMFRGSIPEGGTEEIKKKYQEEIAKIDAQKLQLNSSLINCMIIFLKT